MKILNYASGKKMFFFYIHHIVCVLFMKDKNWKKKKNHLI